MGEPRTVWVVKEEYGDKVYGVHYSEMGGKAHAFEVLSAHPPRDGGMTIAVVEFELQP